MNVGLSPRAERDLDQIAAYIARDSRVAARRVVADIPRVCRRLGHDGSGYPLLDFGPPTLRRALCGAYHVYFTVDGETVRVERILHGARDIPAALGDD
jgi:toxin ParE1/3/4